MESTKKIIIEILYIKIFLPKFLFETIVENINNRT